MGYVLQHNGSDDGVPDLVSSDDSSSDSSFDQFYRYRNDKHKFTDHKGNANGNSSDPNKYWY